MADYIELDRINAVPIQSEDFSQDFESWLSILVDSLNETLSTLEVESNKFNNGLVAPSFSLADIMARFANSPNGTLWYDTDNDQLVAKVNNALVTLA